VADKIFQIKSYFTYWLDAVDEHSLHSPFFFDLYTKIIKPRGEEYPAAEALRKNLLSDTRTIDVQDLGSGHNKESKRQVSDIANKSISPSYLSALYARLIDHFQAETIVELGTSFGINTLYLAMHPKARVYTFEGSSSIASIARLSFEFAQVKSIHLVEGDIGSTLPYQQSLRKVDFALLDANHRYEPTLRYFELLLPKTHPQTVMVIDDIHYSTEMENAWNELKNHKLVYASADLYRCGILFFDPSLNKQHVILQF
jgi:predicted O-methyltransferase YrrM